MACIYNLIRKKYNEQKKVLTRLRSDMHPELNIQRQINLYSVRNQSTT